MKEKLWLTLVTCLAYCIGKELWKAKQLTRELLEQTTVLFTPETILSWYRKLIAQKYDGSKNRKNPGRPKLSQELVDLVIRFKEENPRGGYTRIRDYLVYLGHKIGETTVKNILIENGYPAYYVTGRCRAPNTISAPARGRSEHRSTRIPPNMSPYCSTLDEDSTSNGLRELTLDADEFVHPTTIRRMRP